MAELVVDEAAVTAVTAVTTVPLLSPSPSGNDGGHIGIRKIKMGDFYSPSSYSYGCFSELNLIVLIRFDLFFAGC